MQANSFDFHIFKTRITIDRSIVIVGFGSFHLDLVHVIIEFSWHIQIVPV